MSELSCSNMSISDDTCEYRIQFSLKKNQSIYSAQPDMIDFNKHVFSQFYSQFRSEIVIII